MAPFGSLCLLVALALSSYNLIAGAFALTLIATGQSNSISLQRLADTARRAGIASFVFVSCALFALLWSIYANDFSITYILEHSNSTLPGLYKLSAMWSGQEGSLLLWAWLLACYGFVLRLTHGADVRLYAYAGTILAGVQVFFLLLLNFPAPPFALSRGPIPTDGNGLSPLLQSPEMVLHPALLYLGYVGFSVPFCFALGALMMRRQGARWIMITRIWTIFTWLFLTLGIVMGMHWTYSAQGWGGYWGWDPVENAGFMPWLSGTAFLHSVMMQEQRGMLKVWNMWLIFITFLLTLLGALLARADVASSVHTFAQSPLGTWFVIFIGVVMTICIITYTRQRSYLNSSHRLVSFVCRESSFLFNNILLLTACLVILWGTLFPVLSEFAAGSKVSVDTSWYNRVAIPIGLLLLLLTGVGPLLPWQSTSLESIRRNFVFPVIMLWATFLACLVVGLSPWHNRAFHSDSFFALVAYALSAAVLTAIVSEFLLGARAISEQNGCNMFVAVYQLTRRSTRRYGGYIIHIGVVIIVIGLAGSAFNRSQESEMGVHNKLSIGPYTLECLGFTQSSNGTYNSESAVLDVYKGATRLFQMIPERRYHLTSGQPQSLVAIHSVFGWDLYIVYEGTNPFTGQPIIKALLNPLVSWIWAGVALIVIGTVVAMVPDPKPGTGHPAKLRAAGSQPVRFEGNPPMAACSLLFECERPYDAPELAFPYSVAAISKVGASRDRRKLLRDSGCPQLLIESNHGVLPCSNDQLREHATGRGAGGSDKQIPASIAEGYSSAVFGAILPLSLTKALALPRSWPSQGL
jgi:cytochrome c-type biogenesis protein CcmF